MAEFIDGTIEDGLKTAGAEDVTAKYRNGSRKAEFQGGTYLRPTVVWCESFQHPLANKEFLCPYASVVEVPQAKMLEQIGPSLAVTASEEPICSSIFDCGTSTTLAYGQRNSRLASG